mmetsp:Transcript_30590/g.40416  ORF Transcript_30590/g.40416 Transcript_30590/m.40416 type:complete len:746 (-) Transcript_30590:92-2329(-)
MERSTNQTCQVGDVSAGDKTEQQRAGEESTFPAILRNTVTEARDLEIGLASEILSSKSTPRAQSQLPMVEVTGEYCTRDFLVKGKKVKSPTSKPKEEKEQKEESEDVLHCVECEDQHAEVLCQGCDEPFCKPCWGSIHRRGYRSEHHAQPILGKVMAAPSNHPEPSHKGNPFAIMNTGITEEDEEEAEDDNTVKSDSDASMSVKSPETTMSEKIDIIDGTLPKGCMPLFSDHEAFLQQCKFIPLRLSDEERELLNLLKASLNVSEYTDEIDTTYRWDKAKRVAEQLKLMLSISTGMKVCGGLSKARKLLLRDFEENSDFFSKMFEVGRRYKIMNPEKMRATYGKLMYMLQDSQTQNYQGGLGFSCVREIQMVTSFLQERGGLGLLGDPRTPLATAVIHDSGGEMSREDIENAVEKKNLAIDELKKEYTNLDPMQNGESGPEQDDGAIKPQKPLTEEDIQRVLDSISDANNYLAFNMAPVQAMLKRLETHFKKNAPEDPYSLKIGGSGRFMNSGSRYFSGGSSSLYSSLYGGYSSQSSGGAKLNHDHSTQFTFVKQSLMLWREIMANMFKLWYYADQDLLSGYGGYHLANTGQGLNRVQSCPNVSREMRRILGKVQKECGPWVGLSVVHLGDRDVPNALMFIDKYTQVPRILAPIVSVLDEIDKMVTELDIGEYLANQWESPQDLKMEIMADFFKHGFDGDGDDGGSCIDGRLTSAWNWCSKIGKKQYYHVFNLAGFQGFDGNWKD